MPLEEVEELRWFFNKVLKFPWAKMKESSKQRENRSILEQSLDWLVWSEWIAKYFKIRRNLKLDPEASFLLVEHQHLIRFRSEVDYEVILSDGEARCGGFCSQCIDNARDSVTMQGEL